MTEPRPEQGTLLRTALHGRHEELGARFTGFAGWQMPVRYGSIIDEHRAVRDAAGLFDLSHMGELRVARASAPRTAWPAPSSRTLAAWPWAVPSTRCCARPMVASSTTSSSTAPPTTEFLVVPNASNREVVLQELTDRLAGHDAELHDETLTTSLLAIQGPAAAGILQPLTSLDLGSLRNYACAAADVARRPRDGGPHRLHRRGWLRALRRLGRRTGRLGRAPGAGRPHMACCPAAWARATRCASRRACRCMATSWTARPRPSRLAWVASCTSTGTSTRPTSSAGPPCEARAAAPLRRQLVGLVLRDRGIARHGYPVRRPGEPQPIGVVTSGSQSPTLGEAIAMAYVPPSDAPTGTMLEVAIREAAVPAEVVPLPFYRRSR